MAEAMEFVELISELRVLKGFPRSDSKALLKIAEVMAESFPTPERARPAVERVIRTVSEWRGPAQLIEAQEQIAGESGGWRRPQEWVPIVPECGECNDTGALEATDGFAVCGCAAGNDAREHVKALNAIRQQARELREKARASRRANARDEAAVIRGLEMVFGIGRKNG